MVISLLSCLDDHYETHVILTTIISFFKYILFFGTRMFGVSLIIYAAYNYLQFLIGIRDDNTPDVTSFSPTTPVISDKVSDIIKIGGIPAIATAKALVNEVGDTLLNLYNQKVAIDNSTHNARAAAEISKIKETELFNKENNIDKVKHLI